MSPAPARPHLRDRFGDGVVMVIALGMIATPLAGTALGIPIDPVAMCVRLVVIGLALVTTWLPLPTGRQWRRTMAVSMMGAHHVGVGVATGLPDVLLVELVVGAALSGALACWLLPRAGFGLIISTTLAAGTLALGLSSPNPELGPLLIWASVFLLGGAAAELSVWLAPRLRLAPRASTSSKVSSSLATLEPVLAAAELGLARVSASCELTAPSDSLTSLVDAWGSADAWWREVCSRGRNPETTGDQTQVEMLTPDGQRRSFRLRVLQPDPSETLLLVEDITERVLARREASDLRTQLEHVQRSADLARAARERALRSRSHHLRTPLHNLRSHLDLIDGAIADGDSPTQLRAELSQARAATQQMVQAVNGLLDGMVRGPELARDEMLDVVVVVDTALDEIASNRSVQRVYGRESLPIRGRRAELAPLLHDIVKSVVGASTAPLTLQLDASPPGFVQLSFEATPTDTVLVRVVLAALASRIASVGGESKLDLDRSPTILLPVDRSQARGVEAEVTWCDALASPQESQTTAGRGITASSDTTEKVSVFATGLGQMEATDDEPTHLLRVRASSLTRQAADSGDDRRRLG